jgi:S1-C subfamily serine protease
MPTSMLARLTAILLIACSTARAAEPAAPQDADQLHLGVAVTSYGALVVSALMPNSVAAAAGIRKDDVIISFNSQPITEAQQLVSAVSKTRVGSKVTIDILRGNRKQSLTAQF